MSELIKKGDYIRVLKKHRITRSFDLTNGEVYEVIGGNSEEGNGVYIWDDAQKTFYIEGWELEYVEKVGRFQ